ncbi:DNA mismatch repair endonuclease MutL [cf. Phormidesmis sp. LEGE 11477]|uniref:DNA mismatch repair endonuclease MutL n=1 Tax=cf. Phormidesmis sp. LEGE 11477 TaxID=1828680 RepID=UPI00187E93B8|nr:DNA mismatch repair endonuclease MutL [cf. Phormidesmis sp. LEGE 11477]MBE9063777.1 DNA mismatch repair endonuclease MutL [cf. Phormidesmis sp. LEGE 11477]
MQPRGQIQPLTQEVVHLMAAGEVIDSLCGVVRELVENALDADATRISISVWPNRWQVRVADNGCGMPLSNLSQAAVAHATSKISTPFDLLNIQSLGFRGEALHSIAQLAQLEVRSRAQAVDASGYQVCYDHSGLPSQVSEAAIAPGTVVTVRHLFENWPARRQVPTADSQLKAVVALIHQLVLCHPQVNWQLEKDGSPWFSLWPGPTAKTLIPQLLRNVYDTDIDEYAAEGLYLAIGLPDRCHRRRPDWVRVAINGRPVAVDELTQTLMSGFRRTIPRDRYPICFLHLSLPPAQLDWNRHPAKSEIYVQGLEQICAQVTHALEKLLKIDDLSEGAQIHRASVLIKAAEAEGEYAVSRQIQAEMLAKESDAKESDAEQALVHGHVPPQSLSDTLPGSLPGDLTAIAQVKDTYILAEHAGGVCLIEQHIAHERVLFEQLQQRWQMVPLASPIVLKDLSQMQVERLDEVGIVIAPFGENLWAIRSIPEPLYDRGDRTEALIELSLGANLEAALVATACRTAIRNGTSLTLAEMQTLINQWQRTQKPRTCPHGRPICLTLKESSLAKYFRRSWVIGKSHGI